MTGKLTMIFTECGEGKTGTELKLSAKKISPLDKQAVVKNIMTAFEFDDADRSLLALSLITGKPLFGESTYIDLGARRSDMSQYRELRESAGLTMGAVVELMRPEFPGFSKPGLSHAERPEQTGITLTARAGETFMRLVGGENAPTQRRGESRANPCRWQVRLRESDDALLNRRMARLGFETKQTYLEFLLNKEIKKEARREKFTR